MDLKELKELCDRYDQKYGAYPESEYQGLSVFLWIARNCDTPLTEEEIQKIEDEWENETAPNS